jgi:flavin-dependent thymidylate synthase
MKNKVELVGWYGGDKTHAQAAWTSTQIEGKEERIPGLLKMLADNEHGTPFERSLLHFSATVDTATHIQILKHRHFSVNGESARYKEYTEDKYYIPVDWPDYETEPLKDRCETAYYQYHDYVEGLNSPGTGLTRKRAKESARYFLTYATQVNLDFSCNFRAFVHFQKLRNSPDAQLEIREITAEMLRLVKEETNDAFTHSLAAHNLG